MKTLKIDESTHHALKVFCAERGIKMNEYVQRMITSHLEEVKYADKRNKDSSTPVQER